MTTQLKQRLVGGIVVICVFTIFLPILLHKPKTERFQQVPMSIPQPPNMTQMSLQLPVQSSTQVKHTAPPPTPANKLLAAQQAVITPATRQPQVAVHKVAAPTAKPALTTKINTKILQSAIATPEAWVVQLGSFAKSNHAKQLVTRLQSHGFEAYTRTSTVNHRQITRVFVGPDIRLDKMKQINHRLQQDFHLKGVIRKYNV